jgi:ADP-L-glycero-D-manno-heptose 6-epimerase
MRSLVAKNTALIARGETIRLFKSHREGYIDGGQLRDFVYVKDCCAVMMRMLENRQVSGLFNLGTGQARSFFDLMQAIGTALGKPVNIEYVDMPESIRPNYQYFTEAKMGKLGATGLGGVFQTLEEGVADYVCRYLTQPDPWI